jgi:RNA ligase (TIGR02306 family)
MGERKLASIQTILDIQPIPEADNIEVATVNAWELVVKKGEYQVGDKAIYCEIDSYLPINDTFEFLRASSYKKMGELEGFRLRTKKMRGQVSQGLLLPLSILGHSFFGDSPETLDEGTDVSDLLGIIKYERPIPKEMEGKMRAGFPSVIPSTTLERIQNLSKQYPEMRFAKSYFILEKANGYSVTYYYNDGLFSACSRDVDLLETSDSPYWQFARENNLEQKMRSLGNIALQGELIGEGIMKNPYKLTGKTVRFFKAYNIDKARYLTYYEFISLLAKLQLWSVPVVANMFALPENINELIRFADGESAINPVVPKIRREGIVVYAHDMSICFKVISNQALLKEED